MKYRSSLNLDVVGWGQKVKTFFLLKVVMLRIKLKGMDHKAPCKNIFCPYTHPWSLGWDQKIKTYLFLKEVLLYIKLKRMELRAPCKHIFCPYTPPQIVGRVKR